MTGFFFLCTYGTSDGASGIELITPDRPNKPGGKTTFPKTAIRLGYSWATFRPFADLLQYFDGNCFTTVCDKHPISEPTLHILLKNIVCSSDFLLH